MIWFPQKSTKYLNSEETNLQDCSCLPILILHSSYSVHDFVLLYNKHCHSHRYLAKNRINLELSASQ